MQVKLSLPKRPRVEMVPLIDLFFLLLVFFMFGVFSMTMREGLVVDLPQAQTLTATQEEAITVSLTADGQLLVNEDPITLEALPSILRQEAAGQGDALVLLNADRRVTHGLVISVLDAVRQAGLQRVSFQAIPQEP